MKLERTFTMVSAKFWRLTRRLDAARMQRLLSQIGMICIAFERGHEDRTTEMLKAFWNEINPDSEDQWPEIFE